MKIKVDLFKVSSGKWAYGDIVDIGDAKPWNRKDFIKAIVYNQRFVVSGTLESANYYVVTDNVDDNDHFAKGLYFGYEFE